MHIEDRKPYTFSNAVGDTLNMLFPGNIYCAACGNLIDGTRPYALCDRCVREIAWHTGETCAVCGKALAPHRTGGVCRECRERGRAFDAGISCCAYTGRARDLVRSMKYKDAAWIAEKLADAMYDRWLQLEAERKARDSRTQNELSTPLIIPVPMSETKRRSRGYDQAEVVARRLARLIDAPFAGNILRRKRDTEVMSGLGVYERRVNMADAFEVCPHVRKLIDAGEPAPADVMLVDDVFTTGSTADACAQTLKEAGVRRVTLFTFASGADVDPTADESGDSVS
ncbi:MAG: ComF family protein [Clostridiales Family XIII bacterium]|jgi:ComF family protein|nr:ComF family protein [Clostridiales Family XIII bacterium]